MVAGARIAIGAASALVAVAAGAFGAHALRETLPPDRLAIFETAARYQMFHALALIVCGDRRFVATLFLVGTILFCGSLYILALSGVRWWGAVTPLGGAAWLAGWGMLAWSAWASRRANS